MSSVIQWIAVRGIGEREILERAKFVKTEQADEPLRYGGPLENGWYVVAEERYEADLGDERLLRDISRDCAVLFCNVVESVCFSAVAYYENGALVWQVEHEGDGNKHHIATTGTPPPQFAAMRLAALAAQKKEDDAGEAVDMVFDLPIDLARSVCGFHHAECGVGFGPMPEGYSYLVEA